MNIWRQKTSVVSKLRVKGQGFDALTTRLRFERLFGAVNFLPESLPPKAIVCIKNLRDPAPGTLRLSRSDLNYSNVWRNCVAQEIEKLFRRAFRPISEMVSAQAECVVFADDAEMLACLASDWCEGLLTQRWWWRSLFPNLNQAQQTVAQIWFEAAEFAPISLQLLAKQRKAVKFVTKLKPNETVDLLRQIIQVFGLTKLQTALFEPSEKKNSEKKITVSPTENLIEKQILPFETHFSAPLQEIAPWSQFVPETKQQLLSFHQQCLLGIGLMLARAPRIVRSFGFAREVKIFRAEFEISRTTTTQSKNKIPKQTEKPEKRKAEIAEISFSQEKPKSQQILPKPEAKIKKPGKRLEKISGDLSNAEKNPVSSFDSPINLESETSLPAEKLQIKSKEFLFEDSSPEKIFERRESKNETKSHRAEKQIIPQTISAETVEDVETEVEFVVETRFGGVFYLLNLGLYLNLYRDFTETGEEEIDLNIWDFVALLGRKFLGRKIKRDAVWELLARLAGRETDAELEQEFNIKDDWRMPVEWLETFQTNEKWLRLNTGKRLIVRHPAGFSVIDIELADDVENQLKNELKIYEKYFSGLAESDLKDFPESEGDWLGNLTEYAQKRLLQALNLKTQKQINKILFERKAKIAVTATHFDVTFSLADLPFEVRLSGLDRNPSWIPAAGKFVNFHFV